MLPTWGGPFRCTGADPEHFGLPGVVHFATQGPIQAIFVDSPSTGKFPMNLPVDRELAEASRNCRCTVLIVAMINNLIINISIISLMSIIIIIHIIMLIIIDIIIIYCLHHHAVFFRRNLRMTPPMRHRSLVCPAG